MGRINWKYLVIGCFLAIVVFIVSFFAFPEWGMDWRFLLSLLAIVLVGVVNFLANFRQAFVDEISNKNLNGNIQNGTNHSLSTGTQEVLKSRIEIKDAKAGGDIIAAVNSNVQTNGTKTNINGDPKIDNT